MKYLYPILLVGLLSSSLFAQENGKKVKKENTAFSPARAEEWMAEAMRHYLKEDYDEAILVWEQLLAEMPQEASISFYLAKCYLAQGKSINALKYAQKANELSPYSLDYGLLYGDLLLQERKSKEAIACFLKLIQYDSMQPDVNLRLAQAYLWNNQGDEALKALKSAEPWIGDFPEIIRTKQYIYLKNEQWEEAIQEGMNFVANNPEEPLFAWEQMEYWWHLSTWKGAKLALEQLSTDFPNDGQVALLNANVRVHEKNFAEALSFLERCLADSDMHIELFSQVTLETFELMSGQGDWDKAYAFLQRAVTAFPKEPRFVAMQGDLWMSISKFQEGQKAYIKAARNGGGKFEVWTRIIQLDFEMNALDSVQVHTREALEAYPNQGFLWFQMGFAQYMQGKSKEALASFESASPYVQEKDSWYVQLFALMGDAYHALGNYRDSDMSFEKVLAKSPEEEHVLNNYSYYLSLRKEKLDKAAKMAKLLTDKFPKNGTYLDTFAWVLYQQKDYNKALQYIELALKDEKQSSSTVWEHYGDILFRLGKLEEAVKAWEKAKSLEGASPNLFKKIEKRQIIEN
ncbi:tetratricopeptide repeat protein [Cytophagaceae bacterium 50C-KIRBA]|uniref:Tetratricopeptide repeat protein n=1 Tax=Aquirufa beregesia TaxID=2516556 RepID=A0ABX0EXN7_9BACT|nr:tetratricopeptide repeat protein [Aquirufa beregesia]NGZ44818.1 tetratricopeptide repeat protein [Aquirufa beregesia]